MFIFLLILNFQFIIIQADVDCTRGESSCMQCLLASPECYWCTSATENRCQTFISSALMQLLCRENSIHTAHNQCPSSDLSENVQENNKLDKMLELLERLKSGKSLEVVDDTSSSTTKNDIDLSNLLTKETKTEERTTTSSSADLKELLHKLLLLKLLRKVKNEGSATLSDEDKLLLYELSSKTATTTTTTTTTTKTPVTDVSSSELSQLISILQKEAMKKSKELSNKVVTPNTTEQAFAKAILTKTDKPIVKVTKEKIVNSTTKKVKLQLSNHNEKVGIDYEEEEGESLHVIAKNKHTKNKTTTGKVDITGYCGLYENVVICNQDNNCTWCNPADECIHSNNQEYDVCVHTKRKGYDIDPCFPLKHCKQCVQDNKCYWCDVSKSCHTYPFVGYVPTACGGDWYVKQCDVQLAVIIIVLPLIMILLAMVTFYFCLKYCYYRRKVLRVPLFEKPGVFDYRKDKKVYFVHPDDESSDNEMETEKLRKKYRLPLERAPLIDPNS